MEEFNELDGLFKNALSNAKMTPPPGVWEGVASSVAASSTAAGSSSVFALVGKWIAGVVLTGVLGSGAYYLLKPENKASTNRPAAHENNLTHNKATEENQNNGSKDFSIPEKNVADIKKTATPIHVNTPVTVSNSEGYNPPQSATHAPMAATGNEVPGTLVKQDSRLRVQQSPVGSEGIRSVECAHYMAIQSQKISNTVYVFAIPSPKGVVSWYMGDGTKYNSFQTSHEFPNKPGFYAVKAYSTSAEGCKDSAILTVKVDGPKPTLTNVFTPDGDGFNDSYFVVAPLVKKYNLSIYDMAGNLVFHSENPEYTWDGTTNNRLCPAGKYKVVFEYMYNGDEKPMVLYELLTLTR